MFTMMPPPDLSDFRETYTVCSSNLINNFTLLILKKKKKKNRSISKRKEPFLVENLHFLFTRYSLHLWSETDTVCLYDQQLETY